MSWGHILFGFSGRINRAKIWLWLLITMAIWLVVGIGAAFAMQAANSATPLFIAYAVVGIGLLFSYLAVLVKRLHDRNKSAVWLLVFFLLPVALSGASVAMTLGAMNTGGGDGPGVSAGGTVLSLLSLAVGIWGFVELWCLRGTIGPNQYGPDPLEHKL